jgi:hypothetical protein
MVEKGERRPTQKMREFMLKNRPLANNTKQRTYEARPK